MSLDAIAQVLADAGIELDITLKMQQHLSGLGGFVKKENVALRRANLKGLTLGELEKIAKGSTPLQWSASPAYYLALIEEIRSRR